MKIIGLLTSLLLVALGMGVSSCGDEITNEVVQQEPDNTLELLLGTWQEQVKQRVKHLPLTRIRPMQR